MHVVPIGEGNEQQRFLKMVKVQNFRRKQEIFRLMLGRVQDICIEQHEDMWIEQHVFFVCLFFPFFLSPLSHDFLHCSQRAHLFRIAAYICMWQSIKALSVARFSNVLREIVISLLVQCGRDIQVKIHTTRPAHPRQLCKKWWWYNN